MRFVEPQIYLLAETGVRYLSLQRYLDEIGATYWQTDALTDSERLSEIAGRVCYRSFKPGLNANVTKVREGNEKYLRHVIDVRHGSILEHSSVSFIFRNVSRVFTHELVRHRIGVGISQESLRFVRLTNLDFWMPLLLQRDMWARDFYKNAVETMEKWQLELAEHYKVDEMDFEMKKKYTSAFRRLAPIGVATAILWTCNFRTLRNVLEQRTSPGAEEEIRLVFGQVGVLVQEKYPNIFADYEIETVDGLPWFKTQNPKV